MDVFSEAILKGVAGAAPSFKFLAAALFVAGVSAAVAGRRSPARARKSAARDARHQLFQQRGARLLAKVREMNPRENPARVFAYLRAVDPFVLEEAALHALAQRGLKVKRNERYTGDGGIDGRFELDGAPWLIQVKRYKGRIRPGDVWSFDAACHEENARGLFISTGRTPAEARAVQRESDRVRIISGEELMLFFAGERIILNAPKTTNPRQRPNLVKEAAE